MAFLTEIGESILNPLISLWNSTVEVLPGLVGAIVVLVFGYFAGGILGKVVENLFHKLKVEKWLLEQT